MTNHESVLVEARQRVCTGTPVVLATIIEIHGSSSQPLGGRMAVFDDGTYVGSVSGGCVENDVVERARSVATDSRPQVVEYHQVTDPLIEVGLNCDGSIAVLLEGASEELLDTLGSTAPGVLETRVSKTHEQAVRVERSLRRLSDREAGAQSRAGGTTSRREGDTVILLEPTGLQSKLLIFGATDIATVLASLAARVGFDVTVSDPRATLANRQRHPDANRVIATWPEGVVAQVGIDEHTFIVSLNHEPRFEDALFVALMNRPTPAYIGAIGKPQRQTEREARQKEAGFDLSRLPPIHTPIGVPIGGKSPEEIAVSILAQLIAVRNNVDFS